MNPHRVIREILTGPGTRSLYHLSTMDLGSPPTVSSPMLPPPLPQHPQGDCRLARLPLILATPPCESPGDLGQPLLDPETY